MKKVKILLAAISFMLLSATVSAQPCDPLPVEVIIHYNNSLQELPAEMCVEVCWYFGGDCVFCDNQSLPVPPGASIGTFPFLFSLSVFPCVWANTPCVTANDIVSMTVRVYDCDDKDTTFGETFYGYRPTIEIKYYE
jgi:hypothetical protein